MLAITVPMDAKTLAYDSNALIALEERFMAKISFIISGPML